jgi:hypothetical protein
MEALVGNPELLESLEQIEMFRNVTTDLTTMITTNKELRQKVLAKEKLTEDGPQGEGRSGGQPSGGQGERLRG